MKLALALVCLLASPSFLLAGGEEVVVVYNTSLPESKSLAEYYAAQRKVPKAQVFGFAMTTGESMSRAEFRDTLQQPLAKKLEQGGLWRMGTWEGRDRDGKTVRQEQRVVESKVRYAVLCYGVPLKIMRDAAWKEPDEDKVRQEFRRNEAAVDSELTLLPLLNQKLSLLGPIGNPVYGATNAAQIHPTNGVLIVARLDGPTSAIARRLVDQAVQAERDGLWGRAYFDLRNTAEVGLKQGDDWIRGAAEAARAFGFETIVDTNSSTFPAGFPMSQIALYAGWYSERLIGAFAQPKLEFMPGAFAYHLHSFSAASMRHTGNNWVAPLLERGVTCTMGTVDEPYLGGTPDIATFAARWLLLGMTFGEAACAGQGTLSWQTTVVGDPLYRPFGKSPKVQHEELEARQSPLVEWSLLRVANLNLARGMSPGDVATLFETWAETRKSAVLTEKLADLYTALGKPSSAALACEQALARQPSPQQRIRLRLTLAEKLGALGREEDAFKNLQQFLDENPEYPDRLALLGKILPLAQKFGKQGEAAKYEEQIKALAPPNGKKTP